MTELDKARKVLAKAEDGREQIKSGYISDRASLEATAYALVDIAESLRGMRDDRLSQQFREAKH